MTAEIQTRPTDTKTGYQPPNDLQSPWTLLAVLWRARFLVGTIALIAAAVTAGFLLLSPRSYEASAAFVPQEPNAAPAGLGAIAAQFGISAPRAMTTSPQFYADLLQAREVLRDVLLTEYAGSEKTNYRGTLLGFLRVRGNTSEETMIRGLEKARSVSDVKLNRQTGVVSFSVATRDPEISRQVVNRMLALVNEYNLRQRQSQGKAEREFAEQRLADARRELADAEQSLAAFNARNRQFGDFSSLTTEQARLQRRISIAQQLFVSLSQNFETAKIEEVRNTPVITVIERPEGFVEPKARGTIRKTALSLLVGAFLGALFALARDLFVRTRARGRRDFLELLDLVGQSWLGRLARRWA